MFLIESNFQFIRHYATNRQVATAVVKDLQSRDSCVDPESITIKECDFGDWDPGGAICLNDDTHVFDFNGSKLNVYQQHLFRFSYWVNQASNERMSGSVAYYKVHSGYLSCFCVTPDEYKKLVSDINSADFKFKSSAEFEDNLSKLNEAGIIFATKIPDENGNDVVMVTKPIAPTIH